MRLRRVKQFVLFAAPAAQTPKAYVSSFESRAKAVEAGERLKIDSASRWQVIDNSTSEVVAEDPGS